jgi:hypothetical protein
MGGRLLTSNFLMKPSLFRCKLFLSFYVVRVRHTAIHRTYRCTLGFFMKTGALGTFPGYDIIKFIRYRLLRGFCILVGSILQFNVF